MAEYSFDQRCHPTGDMRIEKIIEFLSLMQRAFNLKEVYDRWKKPVPLEKEALESLFLKKLKNEPATKSGIDVDFFSLPGRTSRVSSYEIHTGTHPHTVKFRTANCEKSVFG